MGSRAPTQSELARAGLILTLSGCYFAYVFRLPDLVPLHFGLGDWVDPYFINFLLEHWYRSLSSLSGPASPPMFFPVKGTLGYSHGLILFAPFYIAVRLFLPPFQAYTLSLFVVLETGAVCLYVVLRKFARLGVAEALLLSAFFFTSPNVINGGTSVWSQRASVFLIPPLLLVALSSARMGRGYLRLFLGWLAGLGFSLLLTQDFYTAAFALLISVLLTAGALTIQGVPNAGESAEGTSKRPPSVWWLVAAGVALTWAAAVQLRPVPRTVIGPFTFSATNPTRALWIAIFASTWFVARRSNLIGRILACWRKDRAYILAAGLGGCAGCLVFVWIYSGVYRQHQSFSEEQVIASLTAVDVSHLDWHRALGAFDTLRPFWIVLTVAALACVPRLQVRHPLRLQCLWFLFVSLIVLVIPLSFNGVSIWRLFLRPLPGFSAIRDPKRVIECYELAATLLTALVLARLPRTSPLRIAVPVVLLVLLAATWNRNIFDFSRQIGEYTRWVEAPITIEPSCKSFFIKGASDAYMSRSFHKWSLYAIDSMFISQKTSIPTLNGYSAWTPDGWGLANPQQPGYDAALQRWIDLYHLTDVCELDIEARTMTPRRP